jgi:probable phosphoglycerate mutase
MDRLILIRHGYAQHMVEGLTGGWTDLPLAEQGRHQAWRTGLYLADNLLEYPSSYTFYSSDLLRASETASIIGTYIQLDPVITADLREINNGTVAYCTEKEAEGMKQHPTYPPVDWVPYPGAESWGIFRKRIVRFMEGISSDRKVLMVAHSNVIIAILHWWLQMDERTASRISFDTDPCSITVLRINAWEERTISTLNYTGRTV